MRAELFLCFYETARLLKWGLEGVLPDRHWSQLIELMASVYGYVDFPLENEIGSVIFEDEVNVINDLTHTASNVPRAVLHAIRADLSYEPLLRRFSREADRAYMLMLKNGVKLPPLRKPFSAVGGGIWNVSEDPR